MKPIRALFKYIFDFLVLFGFLFQMTPEQIPGFNSRRISALLAIVVLIFRHKKVMSVWRGLSKSNIKKAIGCLIVCGFLLLISYVSKGVSSPQNEYFEPWYIIYLVLYVIIFPLFCLVEFNDIKDFAKVYLGIFSVQFVAVVMSAISTPFRLILYELFYYGDDRFDKTVMFGSRIIGIALNSSAGSITCCTCALLLAYLLLKNKIKYIPFLFFYGMVMLTTLFIGRMGVVVEVIILLAVLFMGGRKAVGRGFVMMAMLGLFSLLLAKVMTSMDTGNSDTLEQWMTAVFDEEEREHTLQGINRDSALPEFSSEFILGTGVMTGRTPGGAIVNSDSGYIMILSSLGIVGALFYYAFFFLLYSQHKHKNEERKVALFFLITILCSFIVEYKEPYMLKYTMPFMIIYLSLFERPGYVQNRLSIGKEVSI